MPLENSTHPMRDFDGASKLGRDLIGSRPAIARGYGELLRPDADGHVIALQMAGEVRPFELEFAYLDPAGDLRGVRNISHEGRTGSFREGAGAAHDDRPYAPGRQHHDLRRARRLGCGHRQTGT